MMTTSDKQCDQLDDYIDDLVDADQKAVFRVHLHSCSKCQKRIKSIQLAIGACREIWRAQHSEFAAEDRVTPIATSTSRTSVQHEIGIFAGAAVLLLLFTFAARYWAGVDTSDTERRVAEVEVSSYADLTGEQIEALILREQQNSRLKKSAELLNQVLNVTNSPTKEQTGS